MFLFFVIKIGSFTLSFSISMSLLFLFPSFSVFVLLCIRYLAQYLWMDLLSYFSFQPVLHDWCNKGRGLCYSVYEMVHIKEPLLLIGNSSPCGCKHMLSASLNKTYFHSISMRFLFIKVYCFFFPLFLNIYDRILIYIFFYKNVLILFFISSSPSHCLCKK